MAHANSWLPGKRALILEKAKAWRTWLTDGAADAGIPAGTVTAFGTLTTAAEAALDATTGPGRGPAATAVCKAAFAALTAAMRDMKDRYFKQPPLSGEDFAALALAAKDKNPTRIEPSTSRPGFEVKPIDWCRLSIRVWDEATGQKKRPYGMNGAKLVYTVADAPVTVRKRLDRSVLITKTPFILTLEEEDSRKLISMAMSWETESGLTGAWSEIETVSVP